MIRGNILMMNPLSTMAQTFELLIQEEKQRQFKPNNQMFIESTSLTANSGLFVVSTLDNLGGRAFIASTSSTLGARDFKKNYSSSISNYRDRPFCEHYKRPGHTNDKCFKIYGYLQSLNLNYLNTLTLMEIVDL